MVKRVFHVKGSEDHKVSRKSSLYQLSNLELFINKQLVNNWILPKTKCF